MKIYFCKCGEQLEQEDYYCPACKRLGATNLEIYCNDCENELTDEDNKDEIADDVHECASCSRLNS